MGNTFTKNNKSSSVADVADTTNLDKEDFCFIDGRRYHNTKNAKYILPNDEEECDNIL